MINEPITRRRFFWFLGVSFALAAAGNSLLLPSHEIIEPSDLGVYDLAEINRIMKEHYMPYIRQQMDQCYVPGLFFNR